MAEGDFPRPTIAQLQKANKIHRTELKKIRRMTERQFQAFRKNFSVGCLEKISKAEAEELLVSMLTLNLRIQSEITGLSNES